MASKSKRFAREAPHQFWWDFRNGDVIVQSREHEVIATFTEMDHDPLGAAERLIADLEAGRTVLNSDGSIKRATKEGDTHAE